MRLSEKLVISNGMRRFLKEPVPEIFSVWEVMSSAVDLHLEGNTAQAARHFRHADSPIVWEWLNSAWTGIRQHVVDPNPEGDTRIIPKAERDPDKTIRSEIRHAVLKRDGFRCRYCGIPVVHADIRKIAVKLYPDVVVWDSRDAAKQHAGFQCLWLQFDHVEPHSHGGRSTEENLVVSCALCNFGKDKHTLRQLGLEDPRLRAPDPMDYDGLERLRSCAP
ncbi:MAG TPA: HNH endonuclease [Thermohalobaculum sp.]|nr:HNH endonuclease [Thermohalobaculum sp.]